MRLLRAYLSRRQLRYHWSWPGECWQVHYLFIVQACKQGTDHLCSRELRLHLYNICRLKPASRELTFSTTPGISEGAKTVPSQVCKQVANLFYYPQEELAYEEARSQACKQGANLFYRPIASIASEAVSVKLLREAIIYMDFRDRKIASLGA